MSEFNYEECEHFLQEDVTPWHGDVFDHPSYKTYCTKDGEKKELIYPEGQCRRCHERGCLSVRASAALQILDDNHCMINSLLTDEEKKHFKDKDFVSYLKGLCKKEGK